MQLQPSTEKEDCYLLVAIAGGDKDAFLQFYHRYRSTVFALSKRVVGSEQDAEDVLAEVFCELWSKSAMYCPSRGSPATYLILLTRCRAIDRKRGNARVAAVPILEWMTSGPEVTAQMINRPLELSIAAENSRLVAIALSDLAPQLRGPLELAFFDGLSHTAIAKLLDIPLGTVKGRIRAGLQHIRQPLKICE